jgi:protein TonB
LSPLNNLAKTRRVKDPLILTLLISVVFHTLLLFPFWRFRTLNLTVPDKPMELVLEIPLTKQLQEVAPPRRQVNKVIPPKTPSVQKPLVKPVEKLPPKPEEKPEEKPVVKKVKIPETPLLPSPAQKKMVEAPTEVKPVEPEVTPSEPVETLPVIAKVAPREIEIEKPAPPVVKPAPAPVVERSGLSAAYRHTLEQKIQKNLRYPRLARDRGIEGVAFLEFVMDYEGELLNTPRIIRSSGFAILDREAILAVRRAAPFPKLPQGMRVGRLTLTMPLSFTIKD